MSASVLYAGARTAYVHLSSPGGPVNKLGLEQVPLLGAIAAATNCWWSLLPKSAKPGFCVLCGFFAASISLLVL